MERAYLKEKKIILESAELKSQQKSVETLVKQETEVK